MAPGALYEALASGLGDENYYRSQDPYYMGGRALLGMELPRATNNTEALLGPLLQGLMGGALTSYGKQSANQMAFEDYARSPLLSALYSRPEGSEFGPLTEADAFSMSTVPNDWNPRVGKQDLIFEALQRQVADEQAAKSAELRNKLMLEFSPEMIQLEAAKAGAIEQAKAGVGGLPGIPKAAEGAALKELPVKQKRGEIDGYVNQLFSEAEKVPWYGALSTHQSGGTKLGTIQEEILGRTQQLAGHEKSGSALESVKNFVPDWNDSDKEMEIKKEGLKRYWKGLLDATPILDSLSGASETAGPPPGAVLSDRTYKGQPVYMVGGRPWIP